MCMALGTGECCTASQSAPHPPIKSPGTSGSKHDSPEWIDGIVPSPVNVHGVGHWRMLHRLAKCAPPPDLVQAGKEYYPRTDDHNGRVDCVGVGDDSEAADHRDDGSCHSHNQHALHYPPAHYRVHNQRPGIHGESHLGHDADEDHKAGKAHPRFGPVAKLKKLGNGKDLVPYRSEERRV